MIFSRKVPIALFLSVMWQLPAPASWAGPKAVVGVVTGAIDEVHGTMDLNADHCKIDSIRTMTVTKAGGEFSLTDNRCYDPSLVPATVPANGCDNLYGYVCGPRDTYAQRKARDNGLFLQNFRSNEGLDDAAGDLWITDHLPPHDIITPTPRGMTAPFKFTNGILPSTDPALTPRVNSISELTTANIAAARATNPARAERLVAMRERLLRGDGNKTGGSDAPRCQSGSLDARTQWSAGVGSPLVQGSPNTSFCAEAYRMQASAAGLQSLNVDIGFGTRPRPGEAVPPSLAAFNTHLATIGPGQHRPADTTLADSWARTSRIFDATKRSMIDRINSTTLSPNLNAAQRAQLVRILTDVTIVPPASYKGGSGQELWDSMCNGGMNAAEDDELGFVATAGPPLNGDGHYHRHGMIICPATVANASDEWLQAVIAHEIGHSIDPGALARLNQRYFTAGYQSDPGVPQADRDFYRDLAGGAAGGAPQGQSRELSSTLYQMSSPASDEYTWDGAWHKTSGTVPVTGPLSNPGWSSTIAGCYETASKCPVQEWLTPGHIESRGAGSCSTPAGYSGPSCNPGRCNECFQLAHGQIEEIEADEMAARQVADSIRAHTPAMSAEAVRQLLVGSFDMHCYGGDPSPDSHPAGPARLNRVIGSNPELRAAMGCSAQPTGATASFQLPCSSGYARSPASPHGVCNPGGVPTLPDFSDSCPASPH